MSWRLPYMSVPIRKREREENIQYSQVIKMFPTLSINQRKGYKKSEQTDNTIKIHRRNNVRIRVMNVHDIDSFSELTPCRGCRRLPASGVDPRPGYCPAALHSKLLSTRQTIKIFHKTTDLRGTYWPRAFARDFHDGLLYLQCDVLTMQW